MLLVDSSPLKFGALARAPGFTGTLSGRIPPLGGREVHEVRQGVQNELEADVDERLKRHLLELKDLQRKGAEGPIINRRRTI